MEEVIIHGGLVLVLISCIALFCMVIPLFREVEQLKKDLYERPFLDKKVKNKK